LFRPHDLSCFYELMRNRSFDPMIREDLLPRSRPSVTTAVSNDSNEGFRQNLLRVLPKQKKTGDC